MKRVAILGSTGSIGRQALDVIARYPDRFKVVGLAAGANVKLLEEQARAFDVETISSRDRDGADGLMRVATETGADLVLAATDGAVAFEAVFAAAARGIDLAVANKELIVAAGDLLFETAARSGGAVLPVDSEHSALFQCLIGEPRERIARLILTASGGPFWGRDAGQMRDARVADALAHPTWRMGVKNTIDSATMMNKGLEVIEASRFFGIPGERIDVLVHRTSIAHGMVVFTDGNVKAQLASPDMRLPIGYALAFPDRLPQSPLADDVFASDPVEALGGARGAPAAVLGFERADRVAFPCLELAYTALARGGTSAAVLSAANEIAVEAFVAERIRFGEIAEIVAGALDAVPVEAATLAAIRVADARARTVARRLTGDRVAGPK